MTDTEDCALSLPAKIRKGRGVINQELHWPSKARERRRIHIFDRYHERRTGAGFSVASPMSGRVRCMGLFCKGWTHFSFLFPAWLAREMTSFLFLCERFRPPHFVVRKESDPRMDSCG
jgi:hypothetical protein